MGIARGLKVREVSEELHEAGPGGDPLRLPGCYDACPGSSFWAPIHAPVVPPVAIQLRSRTQALAPPPPTPGSPKEGPRLVEGVPPGFFDW
jgi:hypothetical protein